MEYYVINQALKNQEYTIPVPEYDGLIQSGYTYARLAGAAFRKRVGQTKLKPEPAIKILGAQNITFQEITYKASDGSSKAVNGLTQTLLDITTYSDRAIIKLKNDLGYDCYLRSLKIDGNLIYQYSGESGELLHDGLRNENDIRANGERCMEIGNKYIVDATQCAKIADYWWKKAGKKKHIYSAVVPGFAPWYSVGEWYTLSLGSAGTNEYIDATVEVLSVDCERTAGTIGSTRLLLRDVEDNWAKTTLYTARLVAGGSPKRRVNRSNVVTVASSTYDGAYDYRCDGTDDDVEIQAAIDYVYYTFSGGTVQLTDGIFTASATLTLRPSVLLRGVGPATIIQPSANTVTTIIDWGATAATGATVADLCVDGKKASLTFATNAMKVIDGRDIGDCSNVTIQNYTFNYESNNINVYLFYGLIKSTGCIAKSNDITLTTPPAEGGHYMQCFRDCKQVSLCIVSGNTANGDAAFIYGFNQCENMASCYFNSNTRTTGDGDLYGFISCYGVTACESNGNTTASDSSSIFCFNGSTNVTSCRAVSNEAAGTDNAGIIAFQGCSNICACSSSSNTSGSSLAYGFYNCTSVQQCKSTGDDTAYYLSYADSGSSNACADTAAGGYNS